jgi:SAM-dependent methyltransferase
VANPQEVAYPQGFDYAAGSPHLKHAGLRARVDESLLEEVGRIRARVGRCRALEIGAGHGSFTAVLRGAGAEVTVTEMSAPSAGHVAELFSGDPAVRVLHDPEAAWVDTTDDRFDLVVAISVLHHIPDYLGAVSRYVDVTEPGGTFVSWQDPMWYARVPRRSLLSAQAAYLAWRLGQGNLARGLRTRLRRIRGVWDETEVSDMSEYHVVRQGVDELALMSLLRARYAEVQLTTYWSTQAASLQRAGERLGMTGTFSTVARGRVPDRRGQS